MALAVISGLLTSTALTLLLIPTVYAVADGLAARLVRSKEEKPVERIPGSVGTVGD